MPAQAVRRDRGNKLTSSVRRSTKPSCAISLAAHSCSPTPCCWAEGEGRPEARGYRSGYGRNLGLDLFKPWRNVVQQTFAGFRRGTVLVGNSQTNMVPRAATNRNAVAIRMGELSYMIRAPLAALASEAETGRAKRRRNQSRHAP